MQGTRGVCAVKALVTCVINSLSIIIVPAPISPLTFRCSRNKVKSHNTTLSAGTSFSLTCIITPNTTGVDTDIIVESSIMDSGISDTNRVSVSRQPVSVGENTYETTATFAHLLEADTGAYRCSALVRSPPSQPSVITSDSSYGSESISVGRKCLTAGTKSAELISPFFKIM